MSEVVSKGIIALRRSNARGEKIVMGGETFSFRRLTIGMEEELETLVKSHQDPSLKPPEMPVSDAGDDVWKAYEEAFAEYRATAAKAFRKLTAELMRFLLLDESDKPLFSPDDDIYSMLNNVYAENFAKAFRKFRGEQEASSPAAAEARFPG